MAVRDQPVLERTVIKMTALAVFLVLLVAAGGVGTVGLVKANSVGQCINDNLGDRNAPSAKDAAAHIAFADALNDALSAPPGPQQNAAVVKFKAVATTYAKTLQEDQAYRDSHPLGRC